MEYLDGRSLKELIVARGPAPIKIAIDYARQILAAVGFAHRHGIVHRDIKPHNVLVGAEGRLKVTDFGIARSGASQMTEVGSIIGTAQYLSPEQARGAPVDQTSDLYSVGVVLYEMLTGQVPFTGDTPLEIAMKHLSEVPEAAVGAAARSAARPRLGRPARAGEGSVRALPERRGDGRRPGARRRGAAGRPGDRERGDRGALRLRRDGRAPTSVISRAPTQPMTGRRAGRRPPATTATRARPAGDGPSGRGCCRCCCCSRRPAAAWFAYTKIQDQLDAEQAGRRARS